MKSWWTTVAKNLPLAVLLLTANVAAYLLFAAQGQWLYWAISLLVINPAIFFLSRTAGSSSSGSRILGIAVLVLVLYVAILASDPTARTLVNHQNVAERLSLFGLLSLGVGVLIISGGIDLSIGSVVCLAGVSFGLLLNAHVPGPVAILIVIGGATLIGLFHGLLVTRLKLQPFIVTLCGLFIYRGLAYWLSLPDPLAPVRGLIRFLSFKLLFADASVETGSAGNVGIGSLEKEVAGLIYISVGKFLEMPVRLYLMLLVAGLLIVMLHYSVYGRRLFAVGANEQAARYAGIPTGRYKVLPYVLCSVCACLAGMLEILDVKTVSPSNTGSWYELYAITGAVLGGCSLRGGEGTIIGILLGTAVLPLLRNLCNFSGIPSDLEFTVIGFALLLGTITDELLRRRSAAVTR